MINTFSTSSTLHIPWITMIIACRLMPVTYFSRLRVVKWHLLEILNSPNIPIWSTESSVNILLGLLSWSLNSLMISS
jgi:hypothetical protein